MARYIKANPKVAKFLNLEYDRNTVKDGNYLLWQNDMLAFGSLVQLSETLAMIGAIALMPHEAREEQDGTVTRPLPIATDERFIIEPTQAAPVEETTDEGQAPAEETTQTPAEETTQTLAEEEPQQPIEETADERQTPVEETTDGDNVEESNNQEVEPTNTEE